MVNAIPFHEPGRFTARAGTAVEGGRAVIVTGGGSLADGELPEVGHAGAAADRILGVAAFDAAVGDAVTVYVARGYVVPVQASGAIAAGADVATGAEGVVATAAANPVVGIAMGDAADGEYAPVLLT